jgi:hypothetical protein
MKKCPVCSSNEIKKNGLIYTSIMGKSGKKRQKNQNYRCVNGHYFNFQVNGSYTNSFVEWVVFVYLNCLSLNTTIDIVRAYYEDEVLSKNTILEFLEKVADVVPSIDDIDNLFHPKRSGYLALDGVWFKFKGMEIVLLVCFDPETFDIIEAIWSLQEDEIAYSTLISKVITKIGQQNIKGIYGDGDKGLILSLKKYLPLVPFQVCIVHKEMRMGQTVPVKMVNISKRMDELTKTLIKKFQQLFRAVIYADTKEESLSALKTLRTFTEYHPQEKFKKAFRSLLTNFNYTLTHFDHPEMQRDNNLIECFNGIIKPRLRLMKGFKKYQNMNRYLKLFLLDFRFHTLKESRFEERRTLCPLQCADVKLPNFYNFLTFLRKTLNLNFVSKSS